MSVLPILLCVNNIILIMFLLLKRVNMKTKSCIDRVVHFPLLNAILKSTPNNNVTLKIMILYKLNYSRY